MSSKTKYKSKKALRTTLGTAPGKQANLKPVDYSHVKKPIETSVFGLKQVLGLLNTATDEIRNYISFECDIIYECRVCRTIFRSLANFILHKREYCKEKCCVVPNYKPNYPKPPFQMNSIKENDVENPTPPQSPINRVIMRPFTRSENAKKSLNSVLLKLEARQKSRKITKEVMMEDLSIEQKNEKEDEEKLKAGDIALQKINDTISGVFQTVVTDNKATNGNEELMKSEVMEIHSMLNNDEAILGSDGKIINYPPKSAETANGCTIYLDCDMCDQKFSTRKTLSHHVRYKHNNTKVIYLCPESGCKGNLFANTWSVFRHLYKVHRKSHLQVKRMRSLIQSSMIKRSQLPHNHSFKKTLIRKDITETINEKSNISENNQWIQNFEDDKDLQMCGGCGKHFERRAALHSHSQLCAKRIAASAVTSKDTETTNEEKTEANLNNNDAPLPIRGSKKRKSSNILKIKKGDNNQWNVVNRDETICEEESSNITIFEPETALIEANLIVPEIKEETQSDVIYVSDEETIVPPVVNLVTKSEPYVCLKELKCVPCKHSFKNREKLMKHMSLHFKWFNYQCTICYFKSYDEATGELHSKKFHSDIKSKENIIVPLLLEDSMKHSTEFQNVVFMGNDSDDSTESCDSKESSPEVENKNPMKDPSIQKMIMEVIFGNVRADISELTARPIRNRVVPKKDDFVYEGEMKHLNSATANGKTLKVYNKKRKLGDESKEQ